MKLTIVGCSGSMSGPKSAASSYLLQGSDGQRTWSVAFDLGPGAFGELWRYMDPADLDAVVFSHGHADHMGDIISLYVHHRWFPQGALPMVPICGPADIEWRTYQIDGWAKAGAFNDIFEFREVSPGRSFSIGPFQLTPFAGRHTVESFGYRVEGPSEANPSKRATFAFTGDTDTCDSITDMARGVDLLLSEAAFTTAETVRGIHLDGVRAGALAADAGVGRLLLTHIQPWTDRQVVTDEVRTRWSGDLSLVTAGQEYLI